MKNINSTAKKFCKVYGLKRSLTFEELALIAVKNSWELQPYSKARILFKNHDLHKYAKRCKAFTYECQGIIIVLFEDNLEYEEKIESILLEYGRIILRHPAHNGLVGYSDILNENYLLKREAEYFVKAVLNSKHFNKKIPLILFIAAALFITDLTFTNIFFNTRDNSVLPVYEEIQSTPIKEPIVEEEPFKDENYFYVYITKHGSKYHRENCSSIKNSDKIEILIESAILAGYESCKLCLPDSHDNNVSE